MISGKASQLQRDGIETLSPRDARVSREALRLVLETLPAAYYYNTPFAVTIAGALWLGGAPTGSVSLAAVAAVGAIHALAAIAAFLLHRRCEAEMANPARLTRRLIVLQIFISSAWGATAWLCWRDGSLINNAVIGMSLFSLTWSTTTLRAVHEKVMLAGILTMGGFFCLLYAASSGVAAAILLAVSPFWLIYVVRMGKSLRGRLLEMLRLRFANEDLVVELARARDAAMNKTREVERANAAKSAFLANMSHELRTPLNAILGFSEIISQRLFDSAPERYAEYAEDIHASGAHLLSLINDLLDVSKIEAGRMEIDPCILDAVAVLGDVERLIRAKAEARGLSLRFMVAADAPPLFADERAFRQMALNLLSNALKFAPQGGAVAATCERAEDGGFLFCVSDDGPGIPADRMDGIFQPFAQIDNRYDRKSGGTGLGLALVRGLAEMHGGRAWLESESGCGTRVFVYLPLNIPGQAAWRDALRAAR